MFRSKLLIMQQLLNTSAHLGYRTAFSNYQPYLYGFRNGIAIIDLDKTLVCLRRACNVIELIVRSNGHILFVNTNVQYNNIVQQIATKTGHSYINHKWIGGLLTNWNHMQKVQRHFKHFAGDRVSAPDSAVPSERFLLNKPKRVGPPEATYPGSGAFGKQPLQDVSYNGFSKKEVKHHVSGPVEANPKPGSILSIRAQAVTSQRELQLATSVVFDQKAKSTNLLLKVAPRFKKMQKCFEGIVAKDLPDCVILFNANLNSNAIQEAKQLQIPIIAIVDTNVPNPLHNMISFPIPANGDSSQFLYLLCNCIYKTILSSQRSSSKKL